MKKITIEYDEENMTLEVALRLTRDCIQIKGITKHIKSDQNVKFKWENKEFAYMTQKGVGLPIMRS